MIKAKTLCKNVMSDYYEMMTERINEFKLSPPPQEWDGSIYCDIKIVF